MKSRTSAQTVPIDVHSSHCMGTGIDGFPWDSWDSDVNGNENVAGNGSGVEMGINVTEITSSMHL